jgi:hypothetical protein
MFEKRKQYAAIHSMQFESSVITTFKQETQLVAPQPVGWFYVSIYNTEPLAVVVDMPGKLLLLLLLLVHETSAL